MPQFIVLILFLFVLNVSRGQNTGAEFVLSETELVVSKNKLKTKYRLKIKINNRKGDQHATISVPYSKLVQLENIEAQLYDSNGKLIRKLKKKDFITRSLFANFSLYEDSFIKEFSLRNHNYPYTIVYSYETIENDFMHLANWFPIEDYTIPTQKATLHLSIPKNYPINILQQKIAAPQIDTTENTFEYTWQSKYSETITDEIFAPYPTSSQPSVLIVPEQFRFEKEGSLKSWTAYGDWQLTLLSTLQELPHTEKMKLERLTSNAKTKLEKIRAVYHYLQDETRYINVAIETGGLKPYPASFVANQKYGDCKGLSNYFIALLKHIGIKAYYAKVFAGSPILPIKQEFPSQQFNHILVYIPHKPNDIWLDCTSDAAFNYLGTFTQNRNALIIQEENSHFVKTPTLTKDDVKEKRTITIYYKPEKTQIHFRNCYKGMLYEKLLAFKLNTNKREEEATMRYFLGNNGLTLKNYNIAETYRDSAFININAFCEATDIYKKYGNDILLKNIPFSIPKFNHPSNRKQSVQIDHPIFKTDSIVYEIPKGYVDTQKTQALIIKNTFGSYKRHLQIKNQKVYVTKSLLIERGKYSLTDYADFYAFYKQVLSNEKKIIYSLSRQ